MITKEEFDESCNFEPEFIIGKEPVTLDVMTKLSAENEKVIYATDTSEPDKVAAMLHIWTVGDKCQINGEGYIIRGFKRIALLDALVGKYSTEDNIDKLESFHISERDQAISQALECYSALDAPTPSQLGVLYDAGLLTK